MSAARLGYGLVFAAAVLWGLIGLIGTGILAEGVSALEIAFWRAALGGGIFVAHAAATGRMNPGRPADVLPLAAFSLVGVSAFYASLILAIDFGGTSLAFVLLYSAPVFVLLGAWLVLGEKLTARKVALALLAFVGILLVSAGGGTGITVSVASVFWGLVSGLTYASYYIFGKLVLDRLHPVTIYGWVLPLGALGLLPFVDFSSKSVTAWLLLGVLALLSTYLAYFLYYSGLKRVEASRAVLVATVEPVVALVLAATFLGERFGATGLVGTLFILTAGAAASLSAKSGERSSRGSGEPTADG